MSVFPSSSAMRKFALRRPSDLSFPRSRQWLAMRLKENEVLERWREFPHSMNSLGKEAIFLHIPKNGGTSVASSLSGSLGFIPFEPDRNDLGDRIILDHIDPMWAVKHSLIDSDVMAKSFLFTVVRNPFTRAQSLFGYFQKRGWLTKEKTFLEFLTHLNRARPRPGGATVARFSMAAPQTEWLKACNTKPFSIFRLEELDTLADALAHRYGISVEFPVLNAGEQGFPLGKGEIELIQKIYRNDFRLLGYSTKYFGSPN